MSELALWTCLVLVVSGCSQTASPLVPAPTPAGTNTDTPAPATKAEPKELLLVSYDATRDLWAEMAAAFVESQPAGTSPVPKFRSSIAGSPAQVRALCDGLKGDIAALALPSDLAELEKCGVVRPASGSAAVKPPPCTSTIVFLVRSGNPKGLQDWPDLVRPDVGVVSPSPRTSGVGRLAFLSAWAGIADKGGNDQRAEAFVAELYRRIVRLEPTARAASRSFLADEQGDVLLALESEAYLEVRASQGRLEVAYPRVSLLVEPPVAVVDSVVDSRGTRAIAEAFRDFLYSPRGQELFARHQWRPTDPAALAKSPTPFPEVKRIPITDLAESWSAAHEKFFASSGIFERIVAQPTR